MRDLNIRSANCLKSLDSLYSLIVKYFVEYQQQSSAAKKIGKQHNTLPLWGNEATMNLNPLILANIQGSSYFKGTSRKVQ